MTTPPSAPAAAAAASAATPTPSPLPIPAAGSTIVPRRVPSADSDSGDDLESLLPTPPPPGLARGTAARAPSRLAPLHGDSIQRPLAHARAHSHSHSHSRSLSLSQPHYPSPSPSPSPPHAHRASIGSNDAHSALPVPPCSAPLLFPRRTSGGRDDAAHARRAELEAARADGPAPGYRFGTCRSDPAPPDPEVEVPSGPSASGEGGTANPSLGARRWPGSLALPTTPMFGGPSSLLKRTSTPTAELGPFEYPAGPREKPSGSGAAGLQRKVSGVSNVSAARAALAEQSHFAHPPSTHTPAAGRRSITPAHPLSPTAASFSLGSSRAPPATAYTHPHSFSVSPRLSTCAPASSPRLTSGPLSSPRHSTGAVPSPRLTTSISHGHLRLGTSPPSPPQLPASATMPSANPFFPAARDEPIRRGSIALGDIPRLARTLPVPSRTQRGLTLSLSPPLGGAAAGPSGSSALRGPRAGLLSPPGSSTATFPTADGRRTSSTRTIPTPAFSIGPGAGPRPLGRERGSPALGPVSAPLGSSPVSRAIYLPPRVQAGTAPIAFAHTPLPAPIPPSLLARRGSVPANLFRGVRAPPNTPSGRSPLSPTAQLADPFPGSPTVAGESENAAPNTPVMGPLASPKTCLPRSALTRQWSGEAHGPATAKQDAVAPIVPANGELPSADSTRETVTAALAARQNDSDSSSGPNRSRTHRRPASILVERSDRPALRTLDSDTTVLNTPYGDEDGGSTRDIVEVLQDGGPREDPDRDVDGGDPAGNDSVPGCERDRRTPPASASVSLFPPVPHRFCRSDRPAPAAAGREHGVHAGHAHGKGHETYFPAEAVPLLEHAPLKNGLVYPPAWLGRPGAWEAATAATTAAAAAATSTTTTMTATPMADVRSSREGKS